ncbi:hypothetical protein [Actibacterium ureilyticum]|uniref:hypothetical protein n=1 Tax=Actibacterium ureilyticum TaxID=1590614 RepID=UPI000BAB1B9D|nr:hypothetical protein [Actibacterium ureilyticum]
MPRYDQDHEDAKRCPHCDGPVTFMHVLYEVRYRSGWHHFCKSCGDLGYLPDPPKDAATRMRETLTQMKRQLLWISENGNRWPLNSEHRRIVRFSELQNPRSDDWKDGQRLAFDTLWHHFCALEAQAIELGVIDGPIPVAPEQEDQIPF